MSPEELSWEDSAIPFESRLSGDIHPAASIMYFILTGGRHAFGDVPWTRQDNIMKGRHNLSALAQNVDACDLFVRMTYIEPKQRLEIGDVLEHPALWDAEAKLRKICEWKSSWKNESSWKPLKRKLQAHSAAVNRM